jgi:hypothetical protein
MRKATKKRLTAAQRLGKVSRPKQQPPGFDMPRLNVKLVPCHICGYGKVLLHGTSHSVMVDGKPSLDVNGRPVTEWRFDATKAVCHKPSCVRKDREQQVAARTSETARMIAAFEADEAASGVTPDAQAEEEVAPVDLAAALPEAS